MNINFILKKIKRSGSKSLQKTTIARNAISLLIRIAK
jgi:hypothetical protein